MPADPSTAVAERIEIEAYTDFATGTREPAASRLAIATRRFGPALALSVRNESSGFWTKAGGFAAPPTADVLADVCDFFRGHGAASGSLALPPDLVPAGWDAIAADLGLTPGSHQVKCAAEVATVLAGRDGVAALDPALRVAPVRPEQAARWGEVMMTTFDMADDGMPDMAAAAIGRPHWRSFAVWEDDEIVSVGSLFQHGGTADMFGGATVSAARGRGAQSALITARARAAAAGGCRWLIAETEADEPGGHNPSLHNLLRAGFRRLYERVDWVWRP